MSEPSVYLAKAEESLVGAASELAHGRYNNSVNRAYYACFQAAIAALQHASIGPRLRHLADYAPEMMTYLHASRAVQRAHDFLAVIRAEVTPHAC